MYSHTSHSPARPAGMRGALLPSLCAVAAAALAACGGGGGGEQAAASETQTDAGTSVQAANWPSGYTKCADERGVCKVGTTQRKVSYGANDKWVVKDMSGDVACNNSTFGDPIPKVRKACAIGSIVSAPTPTPTPTPTSAPPPASSGSVNVAGVQLA